MTHPADDERPQQHPVIHEHEWMQQYNEWGEPAGKICACGAFSSN